MNEAVGSNADAYLLSANARWKTFRKQDDITMPSPSGLWVMIEQHPDSIEDDRFAVDCQSQNEQARWIDFPAYSHGRSCGISFADGHSEIHKWVDSITMPPVKYCGCLADYAANGYYTSCPNSPDMAWLQARTSAPKN